MSAGRPPAGDVIWVLVDGIRPDKLRCCGNRDRPQTYLDEALTDGALFTKVVASGANSKTSMHAAFTSLLPSINGLNAYDADLHYKLNPLAMTLTDVLRLQGYRTFRYVDLAEWREFYDKHQVIPSAGFHVWESSGYINLAATPDHSLTLEARDRFLEGFNRAPSPKFAYIHLLTSHELNVESMATFKAHTMTSELYEGNLHAVGEDLRDVLGKLQLTDGALLVLSTDHGARLDIPDITAEERAHGMRLRDMSMNTFCTFRHPSLDRTVCDRMVRTVDITPTILDLVGCPPLPAQGTSLVPVLRGERPPEPYAFMETGGIYEDPPCTDRSNIWGVRTEKWKFWVHESRGRWLIDLEEDPDEERNLSGRGLPIEDELHEVLRRELLETPKTVPEIYAESAARSGVGSLPDRRGITPEVTIFLVVPRPSPRAAETIHAVRAQVAVYWELVVLDGTGDDALRAHVDSLGDFRISYRREAPGSNRMKLMREARGEFVSAIHADSAPLPFCYHELRNAAGAAPEGAILRAGYREQDFQKLGSRPEVRPDAQRSEGPLPLGFFFLLPTRLTRRLEGDLDLSAEAGFRLPGAGGAPVADLPGQPLGTRYVDPSPLVLSARLARKVLRHLLSRRTWSRLPLKGQQFLSVVRDYRHGRRARHGGRDPRVGER